jgi:glycosyltransferase involved in cell wall biosynthesis
MQLRGGSDLEINRYVPEQRKQILEIANDADQIVSDNLSNFSYLRELGVEQSRFASIAPVPGTGGLDISDAPDWEIPPSRRQLVVWPKAYNTQYALALPVIEALKIVAEKLPPTIRFIMLWTVQNEVKDWLYTLPEIIRARCDIRAQLPREDVLAILAETRVLLAPSLVEGRPNTMLEAMASGAFPIVSPLATICEIAKEPDNVLFARNLYPTEIAEAIIRAVTDDELVERAARNNLDLVRKVANRAIIRARVIEYYNQLCADAHADRQNRRETSAS